MKLFPAAVSVWAVALCLGMAQATPITDQDLDQIRQFAAAAMAKGRQLLRPRLPAPADSQGAFSHYYGRHIPPSANLLPLASNTKQEQFLKVTPAAASAPVVVAPAPQPAPAAPTEDPFQTFEQHMFGASPVQPPRSQFNHHSFGPFHFFTNKSPPPPPRGPPPPLLRHNQQLQAVMSGQHLATVAQQTRLRDQQQASLNAQFLPFGFVGKPTQYSGKPGGKTPHGPQLPLPFQRPLGGNLFGAGRPNDDLALIQPHLQPQEYTFAPVPGVKEHLTVGPENNPFNLPIRFEQVQQMPYAFPVQPHPLHLAMVVQSQEFPQYQFNPNFVDPSTSLLPSPSPPAPNNENTSTSSSVNQSEQQAGSSSEGNRGSTGAKETSANPRERQKKTKSRQKGGEREGEGVGEVIFESVRQTQQQEAAQRPDAASFSSQVPLTYSSGNSQENVFFPAPLVFSQELFSTSAPSSAATPSSRPLTPEESPKTTAQQVAIEFFKAKEVEGGGGGAALVTPSTSTSFISSSSKSVSSSVSSAVGQAPQKLKRLRKVKVTRPSGQTKDKGSNSPK